TLDPILYTDRQTGRTIISQLAGTNSLSALTDDDGETWIPNEGGPLTSGVDHQTIGGGPYHAPLNGGTPVYPNAVYYCSQDLVTAFCARSDDGGLTYGPAIPMQILTCGGIHGHVQVAPDGTVYVPHRQCNSNQAVVVSEDNGITWTVRTVADTDATSSTYDSIPGDWDPAVGVGSGGTVYFGYENGDGTPHIAVSHDRGRTWVDDQNVGIPYGIRNTAFPTVIAGDDDRAAFAFHGSTDPNNTDAGVWHLYVATTYDGGKTWNVVNATPHDPVQRGSICTEGFGVDACVKGDRNLLDFMDIQVDKQGRVLVGYADGCVNCSNPSGSRSKLATIARQTCGRRLFKQFDSATDDCATTPSPTPTPSATPTPAPTATPSPGNDARCIVPGLEVIADAAADQTGAPNANASQDIRTVSIAEKHTAAGGQLVFTMKVGDLTSTITPNASWRVAFNASHADNTFTTYFVTVASNSSSNPTGISYNYGFVDTTRNNLNSTVGTADGGSMSAEGDTLTVVLNMNKLRKPVAATTGQTLTGAPVDLSAGKSLGAVNGATSVLVGALGTGLNVNVDSTGQGNYTLAGAVACPFVSATPTPTPGGGGVSDPARFHIFAAPAGVAESAGEPSIGVNWKTERSFGNSNGLIPNGGTVTYFGGFLPYMLRVTFDDSVSPARASWDQANLVVANAPRVFGDPILFTDSKLGRTFVSQELGLTPLGSTMEFTDDDGRTFTPSTGSGAPSGIDHQTVGGGPFAQPIPSGVNPAYPHGVWYCSQSIADAVCALSLDGGITFGPSVPMFTLADCVGLHGHIKIGADGTAYVPNKGCGGSLPFHDNGKQALIVSEDNGISWKIRPVPGSSSAGLSQDWDPSVGVTSDGKSVYLGYRDINGRARVAVTHDKGLTWMNDQEIGTALGIKKIAFPAVVAGDGGVNTGRAAFAFYGSTTDGVDIDVNFPGIWHLYIASTYDGGKSWNVVNATPDDPIQRGGITHADPGRNMLDFFDATIDKRGRVLVGYDDGCIGACVQGPPNSFSAKATIARQSGGKRMFAAYDPPSASTAGAPAVTGSRSGSTVNLSWSTPDNGGSAITSYKVYRGSGTTATLLGSVTGTTFTDTAYAAGQVYRVTAVNSVGEGAYKEYNPAGAMAASACEGAGILVVSDTNNSGGDLDTQQNTPPDARVNIKSLSIGEPFVGAGANKLVFTMKVGASTAGNAAPPSSQWFIIWNSRQPDADFDRRYVAMLSDAQGNVRFEYGKFGAATPLDGSAVPSPNTNQPMKLGDASGNYDPANGTITITLPTANAEGVTAGQSLNAVNARSFFARPEAGVRNAATASDITGDGTYTLVGNASCAGASSASTAATVADEFDSVAWQIVARVISFTL
ncbi:MAG TPA: hypothetical protein VGB05_01130, partial [Pyrinomonadaceae bacterium]